MSEFPERKSDEAGKTPQPSGRALARGVAWFAGFRWSAQVLAWVTFVIAIRNVTPSDYGIAGLAASVVFVVGTLAEFGLGTAIVSARSLSSLQARQMNMLATCLAVAAASVVALLAPAAARYFGDDRLTDVLRVIALLIVAEGLRVVPLAILSRELQYRLIAAVDFVKAVAVSAAVLALSLTGFGYWSFVVGSVIGAAAATLLILVSRRVAWSLPTRTDSASLLAMSWHILVGRLAWTLYRQSDQVVAGRVLGTTELGFLAAALNVAALPGEKLANVVAAATQPFFASVQTDRERLKHYFLQTTQVLLLAVLPLLIGIALVADLAIPIVLGVQWKAAVEPLLWLIALEVVRTPLLPVSQILNVTGQTRLGMRVALAAMVMLPPAFYVGAKLGGTVGIAMAWVFVYPPIAVVPLWFAIRALGMSMQEYLRIYKSPVQALIVMALAVAAVRHVPALDLTPVGELLMASSVGALVYCATVFVSQRPLVNAVAALLRNRSGS